jgi:PAS domain S-box-containing protein
MSKADTVGQAEVAVAVSQAGDGIVVPEDAQGLLAALIEGRKRAEAELQESENRFRILADGCPAMMWVSNAQGEFRFINRAYAAFADADVEQVERGRWRPTIHPDDALAYDSAFRRAVAEQTRFSAEARVQRADGDWRYVGTNAEPRMSPEGEYLGHVGIGADITERLRTDQARQFEHSVIRGIQDVSPDGILVVDNGGIVVSSNQRFLEIWRGSVDAGGDLPPVAAGADDEKLLAAILDRLKDPEPFLKRVEELYANPDESDHCEIELKDGRILERNSTSLRNQEGLYLGRVWFFRDITSRNQLRVQLLQAQKLESVGQLAAGIAHEINTPIQYIGDNVRFLKDAFEGLDGLLKNYERLLLACTEKDSAREAVAEVVAQAQRVDAEYLREEIPKALEQSLDGVARVSGLVGAMKEFSHPGTKEKIPLNLNQAIDCTITVARNEWKYVADMETEFEPSLPLISCHPGEFNQVILNLIVNAAHAISDVVQSGVAEKGKIRIATRSFPDWIEIRIEDTGSGIPEKVRGRVFDPFFTTKEIGKGTGQGLAIARSVIVDKHAGSIEFETEEGKGTTFIVRLPRDGKSLTTRGVAS